MEKNRLKKELEKLPDYYKILNNVMLYLNNKITITDYIITSPYGIFVIEAKKYKGKVSGDKYGKYWDKKKGYYINPINQNNVVIKSLSSLLNIDESKFINIVCVLNKNKKLNITHDGEIIDKSMLVNTILNYQERLIDNQYILYDEIAKNNVGSKSIRKKYYKRLKNMKYDFGSSVCPKCGNKLFTRKNILGTTLVCSNCNYKRKIK